MPTGGGDWYSPPEFCYGREIDLAGLDLRTGTRFPPAPGQSGLNPNRLYEKLGYELTEIIAGKSIPAVVTHGTHVMDIAAGSGSISGMAPAADLIFVQLPQSAILENTEQASARHLLDGVAYVFRHAGNRAAVVNISYNAYTGPHDGTSLLECGLDELLQQPGRAVVISAANARDKKCHARGAIPRGNRRALTWEVHADDDTENFIEIWYPGTTRLEVRVRPEGAKDWSASVGPGQYCHLTTGDLPFGAVIQRSGDPGNGDNQILIAINPTLKHRIDKTAAAALWKEAPSGAWVVELCNTGPNDVVFHAWIERDDRGRDPVAEQSCFAETDAVEEGTVGGLCTGRGPIVVGAYNSTTGALEPYSSAGPTVDGRQKPDLCAPGASDPSGFGILAAAALSANPVRLNGTSMSAPFVTGLIALMFEMMGKQRLDIETIRQILVRTASPLGGADATASGAGRVNAAAALTFLKQRLNLP